MSEKATMEKIVSLAKRRGFIFPGSNIYGGLSGFWDYGPYGVMLKNNITRLWWRIFVEEREDVHGLDSAILMRQDVWQASGHVGGFVDAVVSDTVNGRQFRADHLLEDQGYDPTGMSIEDISNHIKENNIKSPNGNPLSEVSTFNMMFETCIGAGKGEESKSYLRPETAQGIFANFKNIMDSVHPQLPFGIGQIGKAFRNEIAPRDFIFRAREFEQMELEYFVHPDEWEKWFDHYREEIWRWMDMIGLDRDSVHELEVPAEDRAHYSKRTIDFEFDYPFGRKELYGLAYRTDFDLKSHASKSGQELSYLDQEKNERVVPHVIEPSLGVDRTLLAVLVSAYREDEMNGEKRVFLSLPVAIAPVRVAVFPLMKNKSDLVSKAREVFEILKKEIPRVIYDESGSIGKRYRRQDEIGTPHCVTVDFDTLDDQTVTVRDRDSGEQKRLKIEDLLAELK